MDARLESSKDLWTGLVRIMCEDEVMCLAHGQPARFTQRKFENDQVVCLYDVKTQYVEDDNQWQLQWQPSSKGVIIPEDSEKMFLGVKDICAGIGGIAQGLEASGFQKLAALECNPLMVETMLMNGFP